MSRRTAELVASLGTRPIQAGPRHPTRPITYSCEMPGRFNIRILGPLEVTRDGDRLALGGTKQRMVLGALLLSPNEVVSVDRLINTVWGEDASDSANNTLQVYLSKLRALVDPDRDPESELIATVPPGYKARVDNDELDLLQFESQVDDARAFAGLGDATKAVEIFREALTLWRGPLLSDLADDDLFYLESTRLELTRLAAHADCLDAELALGHHTEMIPELDQLVRLHPMDERLRGQLMIALYRAGRHTDALGTYGDVRAHLSNELGLDPGPELQELEERILLHDESLFDAARAAPGGTVTIERTRGPQTVAWLDDRGQRVDLDRAVTTIGRLPDRTIVLDDSGVSRRHAEIRRVGSRFALVDVGSMNGVAANGRTVAEHDLKDGDTIMIATYEFVFHTET